MTHPSNEVTERAAFEAAYDANQFRRDYDKYGPSEAAWTVWQAARASLPQPSAEPCNCFNCEQRRRTPTAAIPRTSAEAVRDGMRAARDQATGEVRSAYNAVCDRLDVLVSVIAQRATPAPADSAPIATWQDRMAAHYAKGNVQCHPESHFMREEIAAWRQADSAAERDAAIVAFGASLLGHASTTDGMDDNEAREWVRCRWAEWIATPAQPAADLTADEVAFVQLVSERPGQKLNGDGEAVVWEPEYFPRWQQPDRLGYIESVGSYKWKLTPKGHALLGGQTNLEAAIARADAEMQGFDAVPGNTKGPT